MTNLAAAIRTKLKANAQALNITPTAVYSHWIMESFLRRLSQSNYREVLCLKGAMLFAAWDGNWLRTTMDIDLEGLDPALADRIPETIAGIARTSVAEPDGVTFDLMSLRCRTISGSMPPGTRVILNGALEGMVIPVKIDAVFGHLIVPGTERIEYPSMLSGFRPIDLIAAPRETMLADKLATIVEFGRDNTRIRDYWDIAAIAATTEIESEVLLRAIRSTLGRRGSIRLLQRTDGYWEAGLSSGFASGHPHHSVRAWSRLQTAGGGRESSFETALSRVNRFSRPILKAARRDLKSIGTWQPELGWKLNNREADPALQDHPYGLDSLHQFGVRDA